MRRLLLDVSAPRGLKVALSGYEIRTANEMGWATLTNGRLLTAAEADGFSIRVTSDQNIPFQQNIAGRTISVVSLSTNHWDTIRRDVDRVQRACDDAGPGTYVVVQFPKPTRRRRPFQRPER